MAKKKRPGGAGHRKSRTVDEQFEAEYLRRWTAEPTGGLRRRIDYNDASEDFLEENVRGIYELIDDDELRKRVYGPLNKTATDLERLRWLYPDIPSFAEAFEDMIRLGISGPGLAWHLNSIEAREQRRLARLVKAAALERGRGISDAQRVVALSIAAPDDDGTPSPSRALERVRRAFIEHGKDTEASDDVPRSLKDHIRREETDRLRRILSDAASKIRPLPNDEKRKLLGADAPTNKPSGPGKEEA